MATNAAQTAKTGKFGDLRRRLVFLLLALVVQLFMLNTAPASPYFDQTLQTWEQGRFIRFHGVVQWLGWLWPFAALIFGMRLLARTPAAAEPPH